MPVDSPPLPLVCTLSEHRTGTQVEMQIEIRSSTEQRGLYRLEVTKSGPAGSAQVSQQASFSLGAGALKRMQGLSLSMEPSAQYRAVLTVEASDNATYRCERSGPGTSEPL